MMRLRVLLPSGALVDCVSRKVTAHAVNGGFCLLPRHVDYVTALEPGLLAYVDEDGDEVFVAHDEAVVVKCGDDVSVTTPRAVVGTELGDLRAAVEGHLTMLDARDQAARAAVRKLEATFLRGLIDLEEVGRG